MCAKLAVSYYGEEICHLKQGQEEGKETCESRLEYQQLTRAWKGKCLAHVVPVYDAGEARAVDNFLKKLRAQK